MKVVILCGGKGTRLREETEFRPKPMVPIGNRPILWHIMKTYAYHGHKEFILCLGYARANPGLHGGGPVGWHRVGDCDLSVPLAIAGQSDKFKAP